MPFRDNIVKLSTLWQLCIENRREALLGAFCTIPMLATFSTAFYFVARRLHGKK
jgi:hypothetical protein